MDVQSARPSNSKRLDWVQRVSMKCSFEPKQAGIAGGERDMAWHAVLSPRSIGIAGRLTGKAS
jgi:hypothetical protein